MQIKRNKMPTSWPAERKGPKYVAVAGYYREKGIPLLFVLREILKLAKTRREAKKILNKGEVKINNTIRKNDDFPVKVFDVVSFDRTKKHYRLQILNRKFVLNEIDEKDAGKKIVRIVGKKNLRGTKCQINLSDGTNFLFDKEASVGDSVVLNTKENKIEKVLPLKEKSKIEVVRGKHAGKKGQVVGFENLEMGRIVKIKLDESEVMLPFGNILVIE